MKRVISAILACCMLIMLFSLAACGTKKEEVETKAAQEATAAASNETDEKKEPVSIKFMHWFAYLNDSYVQPFMESSPDIKVQMDNVAAGDTYFNKLQTLLASNEAPDVFACQAGTLTSLIKSGNIMDITEDLSTQKAYDKDTTWIDTLQLSLFDSIATNYPAEFKGKHMGLPFGVTSVAIVYNKTIFNTVGIKAPATWDEFIANNDKLKAAGYIPLSLTGKLGWNNWWVMFAEEQTMSDATNPEDWRAGKYSYDDPKMIEGLNMVKTMFDKGHFDPGGWTNGAEETQSLFVKGKLAQYLVVPENFVTYLTKNTPKEYELGSFPLPKMKGINEGKALGGASNVICINANTVHKEQAIELGKYLTSDKLFGMLANEGVVPSTKTYVPPANDPIMKGFADACANGFLVVPGDNWIDPKFTDVLFKDMYPMMMLGKISVEEGCAKLQKEYLQAVKRIQAEKK